MVFGDGSEVEDGEEHVECMVYVRDGVRLVNLVITGRVMLESQRRYGAHSAEYDDVIGSYHTSRWVEKKVPVEEKLVESTWYSI